jgi:hypothetical protein
MMAALEMNFRQPAVVAIVLVTTLALGNAAFAEILPTKGTFDGAYHRDRWGMGHFRFFIVHPRLDPALRKYDGKRIRLQVTKGRQPFNPGPAIILEIGRIDALAESPLKIETIPIPAKPGPSAPFQLLCRLKNTSKSPLQLRNESVVLRIRHREKVEKSDEPSFLSKAYTRGQLAVREQTVQMNQCFVKTSDGQFSNLSSAHSATIGPGEVFPLAVVFDKGLPAGEYEIESWATAKTHDWRKQVDPCVTWLKFDVTRGEAAKARHHIPPKPPLSITAKSVRTLKDGYEAAVTLGNPKGVRRRIPHYRGAVAGRLRGFDARGNEIPLYVKHLDTGIWRLRDIPGHGIHVQVPFRKLSRFALAGIAKLSLEILTDQGVETYILSDKFADKHVAPDVPFGPTIDGVKLRLRAAREKFKVGEPLQFHLQAVNVDRKVVVWRIPVNWVGKNVVIEIDGKPIKQDDRDARYIAGWAADWTCKYPRERTIRLSDSLKVSKGKHMIRYAIRSEGGTYNNSNKIEVPMLRGKLISNNATFVVD